MLTYTVFLLAALVGGQVDEAADRGCLSELRAFMGAWEVKEVEIEGKKCTVTADWRPVLDGKFIEHQWAVTDPQGKHITSGLAMIGRDPTDEKIRMWGYANDGNQFVSTLTKRDGSKFTWTSDDGENWMDYEVIGEDSFRWSQQKDGQVSSISSKRVGTEETVSCPKRAPKLPDDANEELKEIAWWGGDFTTMGSDAFTRKTVVGQSKCGWILDGKFLLDDAASVDSDLDVSRYRAIVGIDPATEMITGWEFDSTGCVGKYTVSDKGQKIEGKAVSPEAGALGFRGRLTQTSDGLDYRATGDLPDGKKTDYHGVWTRKSGD